MQNQPPRRWHRLFKDKRRVRPDCLIRNRPTWSEVVNHTNLQSQGQPHLFIFQTQLSFPNKIPFSSSTLRILNSIAEIDTVAVQVVTQVSSAMLTSPLITPISIATVVVITAAATTTTKRNRNDSNSFNCLKNIKAHLSSTTCFWTRASRLSILPHTQVSSKKSTRPMQVRLYIVGILLPRSFNSRVLSNSNTFTNNNNNKYNRTCCSHNNCSSHNNSKENRVLT